MLLQAYNHPFTNAIAPIPKWISKAYSLFDHPSKNVPNGSNSISSIRLMLLTRHNEVKCFNDTFSFFLWNFRSINI